jgi:signal transduction histidine kinase
MFGFDPGRIVGSDGYNIFEDADLAGAGIVDIINRAFEGETVKRYSILLQDCSSPFCAGITAPVYLDVAAYPLPLAEQGLNHVVASYTNVTESYLLEQQLFQLNKLESINTLASGIAHDFNNILGAIVPSAEIILSRADDQDLVSRKARNIKIAAKRAAALTSQLLSFARESEGNRRAVDLNASVLEAVELIANAVPKKNVVELETGENLPHVQADPLQVQQVVINLIINACDASPHGGSISIRTYESNLSERITFGGKIISPGKFVAISVSDEGAGIAPDVLERVFDPFFTTKEKGKGTGLGLSVVHGIVKNHNGFIRISSRVNVGTRFEVYLPALEASRRARKT